MWQLCRQIRHVNIENKYFFEQNMISLPLAFDTFLADHSLYLFRLFLQYLNRNVNLRVKKAFDIKGEERVFILISSTLWARRIGFDVLLAHHWQDLLGLIVYFSVSFGKYIWKNSLQLSHRKGMKPGWAKSGLSANYLEWHMCAIYLPRNRIYMTLSTIHIYYAYVQDLPIWCDVVLCLNCQPYSTTLVHIRPYFSGVRIYCTNIMIW